MKPVFLLLACFIFYAASAQNVDWKKLSSLHPDRALVQGDRPPTRVLLLGTFHFNYPQADGHKTDSARFIDVLSPQRQKEIKELIDVIVRFQPTRVYIESASPRLHDSLYTAFRKGSYQPGRNEIFQVAYRVAGAMDHSILYAVDAGSFVSDNSKKYAWIDSLWNTRVYVDSERDKYWNRQYKQFYNAGDSVQTTLTMLENFLLMAEPATLRRMHGHYLAAGFNTKDHLGPDALAMWWYSRNLRIFNNILKTKPGAQDRILVLFGNGHMPILKQCFESSPEFNVVELKSLLR